MKVYLEKPQVKRWAVHNFENSVKSMIEIENGEGKGKTWGELYAELYDERIFLI